MTYQELNKEIGNIDIYLLDQIMKERYPEGTKILDAGCGAGRNITYFLNNQYEVFGRDKSTEAIGKVHSTLESNYPYLPKSNFTIGGIDDMPYEDDTFGLVICSAVLHFAKNNHHFETMFKELTRVLQKEGQLFIRVASNIGLEGEVAQKEAGWYLLPDGSTRYLMTEKMMRYYAQKYDYTFVELIKTTNVENLRCMTTLVLKKG